jgi:predicted kinase
MIKLQDLLFEGVFDKGIFKAVFLAGGPGSGKSYVVSQLFGIPKKVNVSVTGLKSVNSDTEFEYFLKKTGINPKDLAKIEKEQPELFSKLTSDDPKSVRSRAKKLTALRKKGYMEGKLGMIIDGTGHNVGKIEKQKRELGLQGYDTYMVFVNTTLDVALERNSQRDRVLPEKIVTESWKDVQKNIGRFQQIFGNNFVVVDNSDTLDEKQAAKKFSTYVKKYADKWAKSPIKNPMGKFWVKKQLQLKNAMGK